MNDVLANVIDNNSPKFNKNVVDGSIKQILKSAPEYLDDIIVSSMRSMENTGLEYHGWRKIGSKEEFEKLFTNPDKKTNYDLAVSDLYMIELRFTYKGKAIPKFVYLPYADRGNVMRISDTNYNIVPVLSDTVISPSDNELFVRLLKDKLTYNRIHRNYILDGVKVSGQIIHSNTYRLAGRKIADNLGTAVPSSSLYILGVTPFRQALLKYAGINKVIVTTDDANGYRETHHVYESTKVKPRGLKETFYRGHDLKIMIPKDQVNTDNNQFVQNFIFGILYTLDIFPDSVNDLIELLDNHDSKGEMLYWRIHLGRIIFKNGYSIDKIMSEMTDHFNTLSSYMDNLIKLKLKDVGYEVDTFFDLVALILKNFNTWLLNSKEYNSNITNRYVDVLYYILFDIIYGINRTLFDITKKSNKKDLSEREINSIFQSNLTVKKIYGIIRSNAQNLTIMNIDYPGDNMYTKITSQFKDQSQGNGVKVGRKSQFPHATRTLRGYDLWLGSLLFLSKNAPSPRFRMNPYMDYNIYSGKLNINPELKPIIEKLDKLLLGKAVENKHILESENVVSIDSVI